MFPPDPAISSRHDGEKSADLSTAVLYLAKKWPIGISGGKAPAVAEKTFYPGQAELCFKMVSGCMYNMKNNELTRGNKRGQIYKKG